MSAAIKIVALSELLTDAQIKETVRICETMDDAQIVKTLSSYFAQFRESLEKDKGVLPEYLAWVVYAKFKGVKGVV